MKRTTKLYIGAVFLSALVAAGALYWADPAYGEAEVGALAFLSIVAIVSEMLAYTMAREGRGSIAFIPYLASVVIAPGWPAVIVVALVKAMMELLSRVDPRKAVFNASAHGLTLAAAIGIYLALGGESLLGMSSLNLSAVTREVGFAAVLAFVASFAANAVLVSLAISLESGASFRALLRQNFAPWIGGDLLATPIIFVFGWVYASFGTIAAAVTWIPFLGIRHMSRLNIELQRTNEELLQLMVKSIEARDPYTSGHSKRVSKYAVAIARMLGRSEKEIRDIETAALLHDVGKIYEKYGPILSSPGKLSAAEWTVMQEHPVDGANLVNTITRMRHLVPAVRHHHENWDGSGYPDRVAGADIPLASRIIMFADTIDAMTSERPYRRPLSESDVCSEIVKCRGKQFDPEIADRLLAVGVWKTLFGEAKSRGPNRNRKQLELISSQTA
jgi:putative nucleotidyltransferase with HDIG domain